MILAGNEPVGGDGIARFQALLFARDFVLEIEDAILAPIEPITILHVCPFRQAGYPVLASTRERVDIESSAISEDYFRPSPFPSSSLANPLAIARKSIFTICNKLRLSWLRVGSGGRARTYDQSVNSRPLYH